MATYYKCNQCGEKDSDRTTYPPAVLICWKCRAGREAKSLSEQFEQRIGMFQIDDQGNLPWETPSQA